MCDSDIWYMNEGQNYMLSERLSKAKEWRSGMWFTLGTTMTSAAADVINHNGRKIGRFKPIRFCYARMTSAQSWSRRHHCFGPTSSLPVFKRLYLDIYKTLAFTFLAQLKECQELYVWKNTSRNMHVYPAKSSRFESTDFASVMIDGCSRRHQCPRCVVGKSEIYLDGLVQDCSIPGALPMELLQSCTKPLISYIIVTHTMQCFPNNHWCCVPLSFIDVQNSTREHWHGELENKTNINKTWKHTT